MAVGLGRGRISEVPACPGRSQSRQRAMPLKISLKPGEKVVINGAVISNGDRRASFVLQNKASVLRERDIMQAEEANTPARRIYFPVMMMYLDEGGQDDYYTEFSTRMNEFMDAVQRPEVITECIRINKDVANKDYYVALKACRKLFEYEEQLLAS